MTDGVLIKINRNSIIYNVGMDCCQVVELPDATSSSYNMKIPLRVRIMAWIFIKVCGGNALYSCFRGVK